MKSNLFIPKRLKIGFRNREDTFTDKLAYVIYYDEKNKLRKETSMEGWRDTKIPTIEVDNTPTNGFVLNKGVQRDGYWGSGRSLVRVHHPDEYEFEISIDNLIGLLMHSDVSKRDIVEKCVFAWAGKELILLPCNSVAYQESIAYTDKQSLKVSAKTLVEGRQYALKKSDNILTYIGYREWFDFDDKYDYTTTYVYPRSKQTKTCTRTQISKGKKHVFYDGSAFVTPSVSTLSNEVSIDVVNDYADIVDKFFHTTNSQPVVGITVVPFKEESTPVREIRSMVKMTGDNAYVIGNIPYSFEYNGGLSYAHEQKLINISTNTCNVTSAEPFVCTTTNTVDSAHHDFVKIHKSDAAHDVFTTDDVIQVGSLNHLSARFVAHISSLGYGHAYYALKNGNQSTYKVRNQL